MADACYSFCYTLHVCVKCNSSTIGGKNAENFKKTTPFRQIYLEETSKNGMQWLIFYYILYLDLKKCLWSLLKEHYSGKKYPIKKNIRLRWVQLFSVLFDLDCFQCAGFGSPTSVMIKNGEMGVKNSDIGVTLSYLDLELIKFYSWASKIIHWTSDFKKKVFWGGGAVGLYKVFV